MIVLHGPVSLHGEGLRSICEFTVSAGERMPFVLTYCPSHLPAPAHIDPEAALAERSEEHTSELQSLMRISYAVFCLKKKKQTKKQLNYTNKTAKTNSKNQYTTINDKVNK